MRKWLSATPHQQVQVVVTDDSGDRPAAPGEAGELRVRGAAVFREYSPVLFFKLRSPIFPLRGG